MNAESVFEELATELAPGGAVTGKMFGARSINLRNKAFACLQGEIIALRLGAGSAAHSAALALPGARLWDPSGMKRPFKDWVAVPPTGAAELSDLAASALTALADSFR